MEESGPNMSEMEHRMNIMKAESNELEIKESVAKVMETMLINVENAITKEKMDKMGEYDFNSMRKSLITLEEQISILSGTTTEIETMQKDIQKLYEETETLKNKPKGYKFVRKNDLIQQAENLKKKKELYHKCQKVIDKIKGEALILDRTINILKEKTPDGEEILKKFEEKNGKILSQAKRELEQLATRKQEIDESKALTLEEYSKSESRKHY